jgi:hypothetical protein
LTAIESGSLEAEEDESWAMTLVFLMWLSKLSVDHEARREEMAKRATGAMHVTRPCAFLRLSTPFLYSSLGYKRGFLEQSNVFPLDSANDK